MSNKAIQSEVAFEAPPSPLREFLLYFTKSKGAMTGFVLICIIIFSAIFAGFYPHSPTEILKYADDTVLKLPPAFMEGGSWAHPLGTDPTGRDLLARLMHGARISLYLGSLAVSVSLVFGVILGLVAGYFGGLWEAVIMRVADVILSIPAILLAMALMAILDSASLKNTAFAISVSYIPTYIRIVRASVLAEKTKDYVMASRVAGAGHLRLMLQTILPNCWAPVIVQGTLGFSSAILQAAALGFLGLGVQPPSPEWGTMLAENKGEMLTLWWSVAFPGVAILITIMAFNLMGDGLRDALDPKMKS